MRMLLIPAVAVTALITGVAPRPTLADAVTDVDFTGAISPGNANVQPPFSTAGFSGACAIQKLEDPDGAALLNAFINIGDSSLTGATPVTPVPTPLPSSLGLFCTALAGAALIGRRQKRPESMPGRWA